MLSLIPFNFRFRGKTNRLLDMYDCFVANSEHALHPTQVARLTSYSFAEVNARLEATPELFVKLPRRPDGITRYRLTSATTARTPDEVEAFVKAAARRESLVFYSIVTMIVFIFSIVLILAVPGT